jgi:uncharacterized protein (TIGR03083 family)
MENSRFLECLESDFRRLRGIVPGHLDARVPTCPDWSVDDLTWHVGMVYLHKAWVLREGAEPEEWPPPFDDSFPALELIDRAYGELLAEFAAHDPGEHSPTWYGPDQTVGFWIRRMAQETVIHRIDAELGVGQAVAPVPDDLAIDGIDELLRVFVEFNVSKWSDYFTEALGGSPGRSVSIETDGAAWRVATGPGKFTVEGGAGSGGAPADATVSGSPAAVLRWVWNRETPGEPSAVTITGDQDAVAEYSRCVVIATQLQFAAHDGWGRAQDSLRGHRAEQPLEGDFHVLAPGQGGAEFHPQPRVTVVRPDRLEPDRQQVFNREHASRGRPLLVTEGLDRPDTPPGEVLGHALNEHPPEAAAGELTEHPRGHQQDRVGTDRARREGDRPGHVQRRCVKNIRGRYAVDIKDLAAAAPFEQHRGDP